MLKRLYYWVLSWAESPYGGVALFILAFAESSFFPIPPDILLIALILGMTAKWWRYALICLIGSVLGGMFGYLIGWKLWQVVQELFFAYIINESTFNRVKNLYQQYEAWAVFIPALSPLPYKMFTLSAGVCKINFPVFVIFSILGRGSRFFVVAFLLKLFGDRARKFIDQYFNLATVVFVLLLIAGFVLLKYIWR